MAPSPSSSLNTPASALGATPSPLQDDQTSQAYKDKVRKLSIYIEPLRKMILKMTNEGSKCLFEFSLLQSLNVRISTLLFLNFIRKSRY